MTFIEEIRSNPGVLRDPENLKPVEKEIQVFDRVAREIATGELGRQIDQAVRRQAEVWSSRAEQVVGQENF